MIYNHVACFYCLESDFLAKESNLKHSQPTDCKCYEFLQGMSKTYQDLSSLIEPNIVNVNKDQKHSLHKFIYFTSETWNEQ